MLEQAAAGRFASLAYYDLGLQAHHLSPAKTFEVLLCLPTPRGVTRFPFQMETARKVIRRFKGRAPLSDPDPLVTLHMPGQLHTWRWFRQELVALGSPALDVLTDWAMSHGRVTVGMCMKLP